MTLSPIPIKPEESAIIEESFIVHTEDIMHKISEPEKSPMPTKKENFEEQKIEVFEFFQPEALLSTDQKQIPTFQEPELAKPPVVSTTDHLSDRQKQIPPFQEPELAKPPVVSTDFSEQNPEILSRKFPRTDHLEGYSFEEQPVIRREKQRLERFVF
jgi:hypothetical protein